MTFNNLQKILPFGYLFLVVLGIVKETVFYNQVGINILKHSNLMDVLLGPIADLTSEPIVLVGFFFWAVVIYLWFSYMAKNPDKKWVQQLINRQKNSPPVHKEQFTAVVNSLFLWVTAFGVTGFFLGLGWVNGRNDAHHIKNDTLEYRHRITFLSEDSKEVHLIGSNSSNYFYVAKGSKNVTISPAVAVKAIEIIRKNDR